MEVKIRADFDPTDPRDWPGHIVAIKEIRKRGRTRKTESQAWGSMKSLITHYAEGFVPFPEGQAGDLLKEALTIRREAYFGFQTDSEEVVQAQDTKMRELLTRPMKLRDRLWLAAGVEIMCYALPIPQQPDQPPLPRGLLTPKTLTPAEREFYANYPIPEPLTDLVEEQKRAKQAKLAEVERYREAWLADGVAGRVGVSQEVKNLQDYATKVEQFRAEQAAREKAVFKERVRNEAERFRAEYIRLELERLALQKTRENMVTVLATRRRDRIRDLDSVLDFNPPLPEINVVVEPPKSTNCLIPKEDIFDFASSTSRTEPSEFERTVLMD